MFKKYAAMSALLVAVSTPAMAQGMGDFRLQAMQANAFEIQSSQIALSKSRNPAVRNFAQHAIRDGLNSEGAGFAWLRTATGSRRCEWLSGVLVSRSLNVSHQFRVRSQVSDIHGAPPRADKVRSNNRFPI